MPIPSVNESGWQVRVSDAPGLVLVEFYATWCGSCRAIAPALESIAREMADTYRVFKVDIDENERLTKLLKITRIPTLVVIQRGREVARQEGAVPKRELLSELRKIAGAAS